MILHMDSVKHYTTAAQMGSKWSTINSTSCTWTVDATGGRLGRPCIKRTTTSASGSPGYLEKAPLMTRQGVWTPTGSGAYGCAIKFSDLTKISAGSGAQTNFLNLYQGAAPVFGVQLNSNGTFSYWAHENAPFATGFAGNSVQGLRSNEWAFVEHKWLIGDDPTGTFETWLNGVKIFDFTGQTEGFSDANYVYNGTWNNIRVLAMPAAVGLEVRMHDAYLIDLETGLADDVSDVTHDVTIGYIRPVGVGNDNEFTPTAGDNWENVDELDPDEDTTTTTATTPGLRDNFEMEDVPLGAQILAYQTVIYAKKTSEGLSMLQPSLSLDSFNFDATAQGISSAENYSYILQPYDVNPDTEAKLTEAEANAMLGGYIKS